MFESKDGKKNIYVCQKCFGHIVTRDVDEGTTPFMIKCRATIECDGSMQSSLYRVFDGRIAASHEWYKPPVGQSLTAGEKMHVEQGGLLLRRIDK